MRHQEGDFSYRSSDIEDNMPSALLVMRMSAGDGPLLVFATGSRPLLGLTYLLTYPSQFRGFTRGFVPASGPEIKPQTLTSPLFSFHVSLSSRFTLREYLFSD